MSYSSNAGVPTTTTVLNTSKTTGYTLNSLYEQMLQGQGIVVSKSLTANGNGAQTDSLFTVTGTVKFLDIWAVCTEATNVTTLSNNRLVFYDGGASNEITDTGAPLDLSTLLVAGDVLIKNGAAATVALVHIPAATCLSVVKVDNPPLFLIKKIGVASYIQHYFTGDANTDADLTWYVRYVPITSDGLVAAV